MKNNVLVIGNGFDLAHGLKTSYNNFIDCVRKEITGGTFGSGLLPEPNEFKNIIKTNGFIQFFLDYEKEVPGWIDCERLIRYIISQMEIFIDNYKSYRINRRTLHRSQVPSEVMNVIEKFEIYEKKEIYGNDTTYDLKDKFFSIKYGLIEGELLKYMKSQLDDLIRALWLYLSVYMYTENNIEAHSIPIKQQIKSIEPSYIISFNYTDTYNIYDIQTEDVFHVHGSLKKINMVLGFDDADPNNLRFVYFKKYFQRIQKLTGYLDEAKMIRYVEGGFEELPIIHFYGHSMDNTDGDIIRELRTKAEGFVIYKYSQEDYEQKVINLISVFGKEEATSMIQSGFIKFVQCE